MSHIRADNLPIMIPKKIFDPENCLSFGAIGLYCTLFAIARKIKEPKSFEPFFDELDKYTRYNPFFQELIQKSFIEHEGGEYYVK